MCIEKQNSEIIGKMAVAAPRWDPGPWAGPWARGPGKNRHPWIRKIRAPQRALGHCIQGSVAWLGSDPDPGQYPVVWSAQFDMECLEVRMGGWK